MFTSRDAAPTTRHHGERAPRVHQTREGLPSGTFILQVRVRYGSRCSPESTARSVFLYFRRTSLVAYSTGETGA